MELHQLERLSRERAVDCAPDISVLVGLRHGHRTGSKSTERGAYEHVESAKCCALLPAGRNIGVSDGAHRACRHGVHRLMGNTADHRLDGWGTGGTAALMGTLRDV